VPANPIIPPSFLFRYEFDVRKADCTSLRSQKGLSPESDFTLLPLPHRLNSEPSAARAPAAASFGVAWNAEGVGVRAVVVGRTRRSISLGRGPIELNEGLLVWFDTRPTGDVQRATRFCVSYSVPPHLNSPAGTVIGATRIPIPRAKESPELKPSFKATAFAQRIETGYEVQAWFPPETLPGYDPSVTNRLGFYAIIVDYERGPQHLSSSDEFPVAATPSLWCVLNLTG
jgi:hypothetical protein